MSVLGSYNGFRRIVNMLNYIVLPIGITIYYIAYTHIVLYTRALAVHTAL